MANIRSAICFITRELPVQPKEFLAEIVRSMFLNSTEHLFILGGMKGHALDLYEAIQRGNFDEMGSVWLVKAGS